MKNHPAPVHVAGMVFAALAAGVTAASGPITFTRERPVTTVTPPANGAKADARRPAPVEGDAKAGDPYAATPRASADRPVGFAFGDPSTHSVARRWNDVLIESIRNDYARPTMHARNLYHLSAAMWDAWAAYDPDADGIFCTEKLTADDVHAAREEAISYAMNRLLRHRFQNAPGVDEITQMCDDLMNELGLNPFYDGTQGDDPASFGNRVGQIVINRGLLDGANEQGQYENLIYEPVNPPLLPDLPGNPDMVDPDRWQPLALDFYIDQSGNPVINGYPEFLSPEWGHVETFALDPADTNVYQRDGVDWVVHHDPGPPPYLGGPDGDDHAFKVGFAMVSLWSAHLDPADGVMIDISPGAIGNAPLPDPSEWESYYDILEGGDPGTGYPVNPATGQPYEPQIVPRGDYGRILAEFWADGPDSETPPGHWFTILNYVNDHPLFEKRFGGEGPVLDDLEWDVKAYLALGGAMHDVAVSAWGVKGWYDYLRPISAIRYMADRGQSSDPDGPSYHEEGIPLFPGLIEVVTEETILPGERHEHLAGIDDVNVGKIALYAWRGPDYIDDPDTDVAGVGWILAEHWWPYQRPSFVTPPFAGYVSGHSTFSRAAALVMEYLTGDEYFPGGLGEFHCPQNEYLVFEDGPSIDITLQWARYMDASDQCSLSRIWGGIHPPADDLPGRHMGNEIAPETWQQARLYFEGLVHCPGDVDASGAVDFADLVRLLTAWGPCDDCGNDLDLDAMVGPEDLAILVGDWGSCN